MKFKTIMTTLALLLLSTMTYAQQAGEMIGVKQMYVNEIDPKKQYLVLNNIKMTVALDENKDLVGMFADSSGDAISLSINDIQEKQPYYFVIKESTANRKTSDAQVVLIYNKHPDGEEN